jgi:hypothetical protein
MLLCAAIALHVADEATHNFLGVYNPTVLAIRAVVPWLPLPTFAFRVWITGLIAGIALGFLATPFIPRLRPAAYAVAILMIGNGLQHTVGTILGHTVPSVHFPRPMPGFDSSPVLIAASIWVLIQLRRTAPPASTR